MAPENQRNRGGIPFQASCGNEVGNTGERALLELAHSVHRGSARKSHDLNVMWHSLSRVDK